MCFKPWKGIVSLLPFGFWLIRYSTLPYYRSDLVVLAKHYEFKMEIAVQIVEAVLFENSAKAGNCIKPLVGTGPKTSLSQEEAGDSIKGDNTFGETIFWEDSL